MYVTLNVPSKQIGHSSMVSRSFFFRLISLWSPTCHVCFSGRVCLASWLGLLWIVGDFDGFLGENDTGRGGWSGAVYRLEAKFLSTDPVGTTEEGEVRDKGTFSSIPLKFCIKNNKTSRKQNKNNNFFSEKHLERSFTSGRIGKQQQQQPIL